MVPHLCDRPGCPATVNMALVADGRAVALMSADDARKMAKMLTKSADELDRIEAKYRKGN